MLDKLPARHLRGAVLSLCGALLLAAAFGGCVSKSKADAQARAAYLAGQQQAMMRMQQAQTQGQGPCVTVNGEVRNHVVPWTEGLTLAKALVAADYLGTADPGQIIIVHNGHRDPRRTKAVAFRRGHPPPARRHSPAHAPVRRAPSNKPRFTFFVLLAGGSLISCRHDRARAASAN